MTKIELPMMDTTGKLSPLVIEALANGATSATKDDDTITLSFEDEADPILAQLQALTLAPKLASAIAKAGKSAKALGDNFAKVSEATKAK